MVQITEAIILDLKTGEKRRVNIDDFNAKRDGKRLEDGKPVEIVCCPDENCDAKMGKVKAHAKSQKKLDGTKKKITVLAHFRCIEGTSHIEGKCKAFDHARAAYMKRQYEDAAHARREQGLDTDVPAPKPKNTIIILLDGAIAHLRQTNLSSDYTRWSAATPDLANTVAHPTQKETNGHNSVSKLVKVLNEALLGRRTSDDNRYTFYNGRTSFDILDVYRGDMLKIGREAYKRRSLERETAVPVLMKFDAFQRDDTARTITSRASPITGIKGITHVAMVMDFYDPEMYDAARASMRKGDKGFLAYGVPYVNLHELDHPQPQKAPPKTSARLSMDDFGGNIAHAAKKGGTLFLHISMREKGQICVWHEPRPQQMSLIAGTPQPALQATL